MDFDIPAVPVGHVAANPPTIKDVYSFPGYEAKLIYLLLGLCDLVETHSGMKVSQKTNWAILGTQNASRRKGAITSALTAQAIGVRELDQYLVRNLAQLPFTTELFDEFARVLFHTKKENHVQAFLHVYRILERVSYSLPIAYAAKSHDYKGTFAELREFLSSPKDGELKFFNRFLDHVLPAGDLNGLVRFDITGNSVHNRSTHFATLKKVLPANRISSETVDSWIETQYRYVLPVLIEIRNRYFHFMSGNPNNLTGKDLPAPDEFFQAINPIFVNWLVYIYFRVLEARTT